ncbi:NACHT domain-containing protein [Alienimonas californiensis]|nr:hypothetical protein [Alienimonas californiensis]
MTFDDFRRVLLSFADRATDLDLSKGELALEIRGEIIEAQVRQRPAGLFVVEEGEQLPAGRWLLDRVAQLEILARRILDYTEPAEHFVEPSGKHLRDINDDPAEEEQPVPDLRETVLRSLSAHPAGVTSLHFLTSDAGEGKSTLLNEMARDQAKRYLSRDDDWVFLPVHLGGRLFMRFDDVVVGTLMNKLRFNGLRYASFLELVRLGAVVPALDGFEELFIESAGGDATTALGDFTQELDSAGTAVIAARRAYFQYRSLKAQAKLIDSLRGQAISASRFTIDRWDRDHFLRYASLRGEPNGESVYQQLEEILGPSHPLLTRAVLVQKLLDLATDSEDFQQLLTRLRDEPKGYFREFIGSIIEREARKWVDRTGIQDVSTPLLSLEQHYDLLSSIAVEMWTSGSDRLPRDVMVFVAELYAEDAGSTPEVTRQIVDKISTHALIVPSGHSKYCFDHEEFFHFFLGEAVGRSSVSKDVAGIRDLAGRAALPAMAVEAAAKYIRREGVPPSELADFMSAAYAGEQRTSLIRENLSAVAIECLDGVEQPTEFKDGVFPAASLAGKRLKEVTFNKCYFGSTDLRCAELVSCRFISCEFVQLGGDGTERVQDTQLSQCKIHAWVGSSGSEFAPDRIVQALMRAGFTVEGKLDTVGQVVAPNEAAEPDEEIKLMETLLRMFSRATALNESAVRRKMGTRESLFFNEVYPRLLQAEIVVEVPHRGSGVQRRMKLGVSATRCRSSFEASAGSFESFLSRMNSRD